MSGQMRQTVFADPVLTLFQQSINDQFSAVQNIPFMKGVLLPDVSISPAKTNNIAHKLGRKAQGYFVISKSNGAEVWNDALTETVIPLQTSAAVTLSLWVF